jgi:uncharacterized protein YjdB
MGSPHKLIVLNDGSSQGQPFPSLGRFAQRLAGSPVLNLGIIMKNILRSKTFLFCTTGLIFSTLLAACGGGDQGRDPILGIPSSPLVSLAVTPAAPSIAAGNVQQLVATASFADGSSRDVSATSTWASASPAVATVGAATGSAKGVTSGTSVMTASYSVKSASTTLTVTAATLNSIAMSPATASIGAGGSQQFTVMGSYSDASTRDITTTAAFVSATPTVATIGAATGLATGLTAGTSAISASVGLLKASSALTVTPATVSSIAVTPQNPALAVGGTRQLTVNATYSDASVVNVTSTSTYVSATPAAVTVSSSGLSTGVAAGSSLITASFGGKNATTTATVSVVTLSSIAVTPATATVAIGSSAPFVATATYSDASTANITSTASWTSSNTGVATVLSTGVASGVAAGTSNITATSGGMNGTALLTVTAAVPAATGINLGTAASFAVLAGTSITNNSGGTTLVTGDVGATSQTVDPVQAAGFTNYKSGAILAGALADLQVAITDANSRTCDVNSAAGIDLGGLTFTPGVYCYAGSITLTGTFSMNGPGLYIFRTTSTLDTSANSIVALNGGATASNVFWVPVQPTTLGANSVFKGTVLGSAAAITMGDSATLLNGRVLSGAAVTLRNNQITK